MRERRAWLTAAKGLLAANRRSSVLAALLAGLVFFGLWSMAGSWRAANEQRTLRERVLAGLAFRRSSLSSTLAKRFALLEGLRAFTEVKLARGEPLEEQYDDFASRLFGVAAGTRNLAVAEGSTYRFVYPREGNEQVVGYDLLADVRPEVVDDTRRAMAGGGIALSGPYELRQGGTGLVARLAVAVNGRFWGLAAMAMDLQPILAEANLSRADSWLDVAVRRPGGKAFVGADGIFSADAIVDRVALPIGYWEIAARPKGGWLASGADARRAWQVVGLMIALAPAVLLLGAGWRQRVLRWARLDAERRVREGTRKLARTTDLLEGVLRSSPLPVVAFDEQGLVRVWNAAAERVFGWTAEETLGRVNPIVPPASAAEFEELQRRMRAGEAIPGLEVERRRKDGALVNLRLFTAPVLGSDGRFAGIMAVAEDITERLRIERDLERAITDRETVEAARQGLERRLREMLDTVQVIAVVLDTSGRVTFCNQYLNQLTGWSRDELIGRDWFEACVPAALRAQGRGFFEASLAGDDSGGGDHEFPIAGRDGSLREISWQSTVLREPSGRVVGTASFGRDVTEQRQLEAQYRQAQKMEAVGQLAGGIAHDFNNLLQVITGYAALGLADVTPTEPLHVELMEIRRASERASALVRQLLAFSRRQKIERRPLDLNDAVADLLKMLGRVIGEDIELEFAPGERLHPVLADAGLLEQVLMNLCVNARDAMPGGGRVRITSENVTVGREFVEQRAWGQEGEYVLLTVTDTGPGIPPGLHDRIFEPFFTTKEVGKGTGLGLATVYGIVKQHEGMIEVARDTAPGASFRIYLPVAPGAVAESAGDAIPEKVAGGHETILLAEDEELVRNLAVRVLERAGYRVLVARDGEAALEIVEAQAKEIDLALIDVVMPKVSGRDVCLRLRAMRPDVPVVFCTGYSRQVLDESWIPDEGVELLVKPYEPKALLHRVRTRLGAPRGPSA
jgi:two-component system, cell cycle sensor histidine kinase and response regulator CckA